MTNDPSSSFALSSMSTQAFLESRRPTTARRLLSLVWALYGIAWAVFSMLPIVVGIYLVLHCTMFLDDLPSLAEVLASLYRPALAYAQLVVVHILVGACLRKSKHLLLSLGVMVFELSLQVFLLWYYRELLFDIFSTIYEFVATELMI